MENNPVKEPEANDPKGVVERGYDAAAEAYARLEEGTTWPRMRWLKKLLEKMPPGSTVLDLGCGSGDPADVEIVKAHAVIGVDISEKQIELARKNVPEGTFIHSDAGSIEFPAGSCEAVVSFYALEHIPREEHEGLFRRIYGWLRPGGYLLISLEAGEMEGVIGEWLEVPMYFSNYPPDTVKGLVEMSGFSILESDIEVQIEQGNEIPYLWIFAQK
jgi:ubiquinone/menaquinone biosynthesis C-methylase UbiE